MVDKHEIAKEGFDIASALLIISAWANVLHPILEIIGTLISIGWFSVRLWESETVRKLTGRSKNG